MLSVETHIITQSLNLVELNCQCHMARFDLVDPMISGNKLYKLHYFIELAQKRGINTIVTLGGAYSNHLAATATYCKQASLHCAAIVRGEMNEKKPSPTLQYCIQNGMKLFFVERQQYGNVDPHFVSNITQYPLDSFLFIPEGGYERMGEFLFVYFFS